jgi:serine protease Do
MKARRKIFDRKLLVGASVLVTLGLLSVGLMPALGRDKPNAPPADAMRYANSLSQAFEYAAKKISPSIVTIRAVKHFKPSANNGENQFFQFQIPNDTPFGNQLLKRFFNQLPSQVPPQQGLGSGVIVSGDGYILTNNHVVGQADEVSVQLPDGSEHEAKVIGTDPMSDLAVIQIKAKGLPVARLGNSDDLKVGEWVVAAGNPFGLNDTITAGIVSATGRSNMRIAEYEDFIQTDAAINPGNSGGALVDIEGDVVGINTAIATSNGGSNGVGFAIPINMARSVMNSLIHHGRVIRGWLGVGIQPLTAHMAKSFGYDSKAGVLIGEVMSGGPADHAGMEPGDIVTEFNGTKIKDVSQFRNLVASTEPGTKADIEVFRNGAEKTLTAKLTKRTEDTGSAASGREESTELGMHVQNLTSDEARSMGLDPDTHGVLVTDVDPGGVAGRAGLETGNVILKVQGTPVENTAEFHRQLRKQDLKKGVRLLIQAGDTQHFVLLRTGD